MKCTIPGETHKQIRMSHQRVFPCRIEYARMEVVAMMNAFPRRKILGLSSSLQITYAQLNRQMPLSQSFRSSTRSKTKPRNMIRIRNCSNAKCCSAISLLVSLHCCGDAMLIYQSLTRTRGSKIGSRCNLTGRNRALNSKISREQRMCAHC